MIIRRFDPSIHHRQSTRLKGYDYATEGSYFITMCLKNREKILSNIHEGKLTLTEYGKIAEKAWTDLPVYNSGIVLDEFVIMPDHVHVLITINGPLKTKRKQKLIKLSEIIRQFKTYSAIRINKFRNTTGTAVWQRNYHDRILRINEMARYRNYIRYNPKKIKQG